MKLILSILFFFYITVSFGTNYYVGSGGNNNNNGTSVGTRWLNVTKVNSSTFSSGDSILFAGSQTHIGGLKVPSNGVIIASYGTGQAIISGLVILSGWSSVGTNLWECTPSQPVKALCNVVLVDEIPVEVGRTPNYNTYYTYQSANNNSMTSNALTGTPNYSGAQLVIKKNAYDAEKLLVTTQIGNTVSYVTTARLDGGGAVTPGNGQSGYGFYFQRFAASLDRQNEWYFNPTTNKMRMYSTIDPDGFDVKASYLDTIIYLGNHTNVTLSNLNIEGGSMYGVYSINGTNVTTKNCTINFNTIGVFYRGGLNLIISDNVIRNSMSCAISINPSAKQITIQNNTINNTAVFLGMGEFGGDHSLKGIGAKTDQTTTSNWLNIIGNVVRYTGYTGIDFRGSNVTVKYNWVDSALFHIDDGGLIYTWVRNDTIDNVAYLNRVVDSNFMSNTIGALEGTTGTVVRGNGLYIDDQAKEIKMRGNTVWNIRSSGIIMNNPRNNIVTGNTVYNAFFAHKINMKPHGAISGNVVKRNIFYAKTALQYNFAHINFNLSQPTPITITQSLQGVAFIDTNWITNLKTAAYNYYYSSTGVSTTFPPDFNLATWRSSYLHDLVSVLPPVPVTSTNTTLHTNPSNNLLVVNFPGLRKIDPKSVIYDHSATVGRWSSLILIDNGNAPAAGNIPPIARAGNDVTITLPTNSTSLSGSTSTDADGTIVAYLWSKISGPTGGTITTPSSVNTTVTSLTQGTYNFRLKVTDNIGDTSVDFVQVQVNAAPVAPVANAGADQTIQLPNNATTVSGSGSSDVDGTIVSYSWAKISGPTGGNINSPNSMTTPITNMIAGIYVFSLTVTDNSGLQGTDFIQITVNAIVPPQNQPPVAEAGPNQTISLPDNTAAVDASDSYDPEGLALTYLWKKISGPTGGAITNTTMAATCISGLVAGTYIYQVTVKDPSGDSSVDALSITVQGANQPPVANAGSDQTITLPTNSVTLSATGSDPEGGAITFAWLKLSGPNATIVSPTNQTTVVNNLTQGTYIFQVTVTDNLGNQGSDAVQVTVNAANIAPTANAGADQVLTLPTNSTTLVGSGTDPDGTITAYLWTKVSGPAGGNITSSTSATTGITSLQAGTYVYSLRVTDNSSATGSDFVQIVVNPANIAPTANAGSDQTITLPTSSTTLTGSGTDPDGTIASYSWVKISGPAGGNVVQPSNASTGITALQQGTYVFRLTVTDDDGATGIDFVQVVVNPAIPPVNQPPVSNAGSDQAITLPTSTTNLIGSASSDPDGTITAYLWTKISGPSGGNITNSTFANTGVTGLLEGVYIYQLRVTDNSGDTATDAVQVRVFPANIAPTANAGADQILTLPTNSTTLVGSGTDPDGTISAYLWTKISGPTGGNITSSTASTTGITALIQGVYIYQLRVTDNAGDTATDAVQITVNAANIAPTANAGPNQVLTLPTNSTSLFGTGSSDPDGTITAYLWTKISGPTTGTIVTPTSVNTNLTNLVEGTYNFRLKVTDNSGDTGVAFVQVLVNAEPINLPPTVFAGNDTTITLPSNSVTLNAVATDPEGSDVDYLWEQLSGPTVTIVTTNGQSTVVNGFTQGSFIFQVTVTDSLGNQGTDAVQVTVNPAPPLLNPVADAGIGQTIQLPTNTTTLVGSATDQDGTIVSYGWVQISGPNSATGIPSASASQAIGGLIAGTYQFQLTATDNDGLTGKDTVAIIVQAAPSFLPIASAGGDINTIDTFVVLNGSGSDQNGSIVSYSWVKISGNVGDVIQSPTNATTVVSGLSVGTYVYELTVTDNNGNTATDTATITVETPSSFLLRFYKLP